LFFIHLKMKIAKDYNVDSNDRRISSRDEEGKDNEMEVVNAVDATHDDGLGSIPALGGDVLANIVSFMNEEGLYRLENAVSNAAAAMMVLRRLAVMEDDDVEEEGVDEDDDEAGDLASCLNGQWAILSALDEERPNEKWRPVEFVDAKFLRWERGWGYHATRIRGRDFARNAILARKLAGEARTTYGLGPECTHKVSTPSGYNADGMSPHWKTGWVQRNPADSSEDYVFVHMNLLDRPDRFWHGFRPFVELGNFTYQWFRNVEFFNAIDISKEMEWTTGFTLCKNIVNRGPMSEGVALFDQAQEREFFKEMVSNMQVTMLSEGGLLFASGGGEPDEYRTYGFYADLPLRHPLDPLLICEGHDFYYRGTVALHQTTRLTIDVYWYPPGVEPPYPH
jgi:hypothetical protein